MGSDGADAAPRAPTAAPPAPRRAVVHACIAILCLVWSNTWWAIRQGLQDLPPLTAAAARFLLAGLTMVPIAHAFAARERGTPPPRWLWLAQGLCSFAGSFGILYHCERTVPSGIAAVLWAVFPALMAISGHFVLGERLTVRKAIGFATAFAGVAVMFGGGLGLGAEAGAAIGPALVLLASPVVSAVGTTLVKRHGRAHSSLLLNRNAMLFGGALLALAAAIAERDAPARWTGRAIASVAFLAWLGSCLTFGIYYWLLRHAQASRLALISYVTPCLALVLGWMLGDGTLDAPALAGTALIALGIALVVRTPGPAAPR